MAGATPAQRTLKAWRDWGYEAAVVEKWNPHAKIRQDLFGFADVLAYDGEHCVMVQATSGSNCSSRVKKILGDPQLTARVLKWVEAADRAFEVWAWRKAGARGKRKTWQPRRVELVYNAGELLEVEV